MKIAFAPLLAAFALVVSLQSDATVQISGVHLCCQNCVRGAQQAVATVPGVSAAVDREAGTVSLSGPDKTTVQRAADALTAAGYFGTSSDPGIKIHADTGAKGETVQAMQVDGVHLCCRGCVAKVDASVKSVAGVKAHTAAKDAKSFQVEGSFVDREVFDALQKAGLTGKVGH